MLPVCGIMYLFVERWGLILFLDCLGVGTMLRFHFLVAVSL